MEDETINNKRPYKVKDVSRANCKGIVASSLDEVRAIASDKFGKNDVPNIHLDSDGTEVDDEDYFQTLEPNTELIAVFEGEQWIDPTHYVTITTRRNSGDITDSPEVERVHLKKIVTQLKNNLYNVAVLSEPDLEMITNMDPNSVADITGKDFIEQLKEVSGRFLHEKREALDAIELLKMFAKQKGIRIDFTHDESDADGDHHQQQQHPMNENETETETIDDQEERESESNTRIEDKNIITTCPVQQSTSPLPIQQQQQQQQQQTVQTSTIEQSLAIKKTTSDI